MMGPASQGSKLPEFFAGDYLRNSSGAVEYGGAFENRTLAEGRRRHGAGTSCCGGAGQRTSGGAGPHPGVRCGRLNIDRSAAPKRESGAPALKGTKLYTVSRLLGVSILLGLQIVRSEQRSPGEGQRMRSFLSFGQ